MSVAEIKEQLRNFSAEELAELEDALSQLRRESQQASPRVREAQASDPDVLEAIDEVAQKHHELMRRLAQ